MGGIYTENKKPMYFLESNYKTNFLRHTPKRLCLPQQNLLY